jgi:hypothetical protein
VTIADRLLRELFDPMQQQKRHAIDTLRRITERKASEVERKASEVEPWRRWVTWLAFAITARRIEAA